MAHRSFPEPDDPVIDARVGRLADRLGPGGRQRFAAVIAVLLVGGAGWWLLRPAPPPVDAVVPLAGTAPASEPTTVVAAGGDGGGGAPVAEEVEVVAQVAGAVVRPGVYRLPEGARVDDLVREAGGFAPEADRARINLAAPLGDGVRVWVPAEGETDVPDVVDPEGGAPPAGTGGGEPSAEAPVDINTADAAALETLPGVGPATSAAIIAHREEQGPFASVEELIDVRGIGEAKLEQLRPLVTV